MYDPQNPVHTALAAQALYVKLQKLSEDIQLQHSILNAQKETVLKSRQRIYFDPQANKTSSPVVNSHAVHTHADTVMQHRAMIHKHYDLIRQHKQMVKDQGAHVQNLASTLLNIQQETTVVDELMNTRMIENNNYNNKTRTLTQAPLSLVNYPCSPDISLKNKKRNSNNKTSRKQTTTTTSGLITTNGDNETSSFIISGSKIPTTDNNTIHVSITSAEDNNHLNNDELTSIILTTTSTSTLSSSPSSSPTLSTTVSSISTTTITSTTATTTTTTTFTPRGDNKNEIANIEFDNVPLPLSP